MRHPRAILGLEQEPREPTETRYLLKGDAKGPQRIQSEAEGLGREVAGQERDKKELEVKKAEFCRGPDESFLGPRATSVTSCQSPSFAERSWS